jgi:hypothetical protein
LQNIPRILLVVEYDRCDRSCNCQMSVRMDVCRTRGKQVSSTERDARAASGRWWNGWRGPKGAVRPLICYPLRASPRSMQKCAG